MYSATAYAAPASAANSASTGLASAVTNASTTASPGRRRWSASAVPTAACSPNANVSRPVNRLVAVATPNHSDSEPCVLPEAPAGERIEQRSGAHGGRDRGRELWRESGPPTGGNRTL